MAYAFNQLPSSASAAADEAFQEMEELERMVSGKLGLVRDGFTGSAVSVDLTTSEIESTIFKFGSVSVMADGDGLFVDAMIVGVRKGAGKYFEGSLGLAGNSRLQFRVEAAGQACANHFFCGRVAGEVSLNAVARNSSPAARNVIRAVTPRLYEDQLRGGHGAVVPLTCRALPETCRY